MLDAPVGPCSGRTWSPATPSPPTLLVQHPQSNLFQPLRGTNYPGLPQDSFQHLTAHTSSHSASGSTTSSQDLRGSLRSLLCGRPPLCLLAVELLSSLVSPANVTYGLGPSSPSKAPLQGVVPRLCMWWTYAGPLCT